MPQCRLRITVVFSVDVFVVVAIAATANVVVPTRQSGRHDGSLQTSLIVVVVIIVAVVVVVVIATNVIVITVVAPTQQSGRYYDSVHTRWV